MGRELHAGTKGLLVFVANELGNFRHHREHLARAAMANGLTPVLVAAPTGSTEGMDYEYRPIAIDRFRINWWLDLKLFFFLLSILMVEKPQGLHLINIKPYLFGGLLARLSRLFGWRGTVVMTVPGLGRLYDKQDQSRSARIRRHCVEALLRIAAKDARVTFETQHDRDFWLKRRLVRDEQTFVTQGAGIDLSRFAPVRTVSPGARIRVLFAGRLLRSKGLDAFLKAASLTAHPSIDFWVAGFRESDPDAVTEAELQNHRSIRFLGAVADMPQLLAETDFVVLPSRYNEGVPRILIEAAACGCVPIATRFAGSEAIIDHGRTGLFLESQTPDEQAVELAALVTALAENNPLRQEIGASASTLIRSKGFSSEAVAASFLRLYQPVLS